MKMCFVNQKGSEDAKGVFAPIAPPLRLQCNLSSIWGYNPKEFELYWKNQH